MSGRHFPGRRGASAGCLALVFALMAAPAAAVMPAAWKTTNYALAPGEARVRDVLADLQKTMGLSIEMTRDVQGSITSTGEPTTVEGLLNKMAVSNGLNWFVFRNRLYVARESEVQEVHLPAPADQVAELRSYLAGLRLLEDKFGWVEMASRNEVTVIGPPGYIQLIKQHAASVKLVKPKEPTPVEPMQIMTFRLRHANAVDIPAAGGTAMVPGIASLLGKLYGELGASDGSMPGGDSLLKQASLLDKRRNRQVAETSTANAVAVAARRTSAETGGDDEPQGEPAIPAFPVRLRSLAPESGTGTNFRALVSNSSANRQPGNGDEMPTIAADARLNMILVRDRPSKRPEYERIIADLDVATLQFGLSAMVLELDTDAMGALLADVASAPRPGPLASSFVVSRNVIEALYPALRAARTCKQDVSLVSQSIVFRENDAFGLNFADDLTYPTLSTPFWYSLLSKLAPLPEEQQGKARTIGLKIVGSARSTGEQRVALRFELTDGRDNPIDRGNLISKRLTEAHMSVELADDEVLVLVDGTVWSGNDMKAARSRMVMLSARRWSRDDAPRQIAAAAALAPSATGRAPACAASASSPTPSPSPALARASASPSRHVGPPVSVRTSGTTPAPQVPDVYAR